MLDDQGLIRQSRQGQAGFLDVLIERYQVTLYSLCRKLTRDPHDADDLFQDTWAAAVSRLDSFSNERAFRPWLFAICVNRYRDRYRKKVRWLKRWKVFRQVEQLDRALANASSPAPAPDEEAEAAERREACREALSQLDDRHRLPVILHYHRGLALQEISHILGIPAGTVKSRLSTARTRLRAALEAKGHG